MFNTYLQYTSENTENQKILSMAGNCCLINNKKTPSMAGIELINWDNEHIQTNLTHAVISEFDVSLWLQQNIVQLQVPVNDSTLMEVVQGETDLCWVKPASTKNKRKMLVTSFVFLFLWCVIQTEVNSNPAQAVH